MGHDARAEFIPPNDTGAEQQVLGCCMTADELWRQDAAAVAFEVITPGDFYREYHKAIADAIVHCHAEDGFVTMPTVAAELRRRGKLQECGGEDYLRALIELVELPQYVSKYAALVKDKATLRGLMRAGSELQCLGADNPCDVAGALERASEIVSSLQAQARPPEALALRTLSEVDGALPSFLWPGWVARGGLSMLFAPPGAGKSYAALALMKAVVTGEEWPDGQPGPERTTVLLLDFEATLRETKNRAELLGVPDNMILLPPEGMMPYLNQPGSLEVIRGFVAQSGASLVVIDSLRDATPGLDENDSMAMSAALSPLKGLAEEFNCGILLLHHCRKQQVCRGNRWVLSMDDARGTGAMLAVARTMLAIDKPDASRDTRLLKVVKANNSALPDPVGFDLTSEGLVWTEAPHGGREMPQQSAALEALRLELQGGPLGYSDLERRLALRGISEATMRRARKQLEEAGEVVKGKDGRWGLVEWRHFAS